MTVYVATGVVSTALGSPSLIALFAATSFGPTSTVSTAYFPSLQTALAEGFTTTYFTYGIGIRSTPLPPQNTTTLTQGSSDTVFPTPTTSTTVSGLQASGLPETALGTATLGCAFAAQPAPAPEWATGTGTSKFTTYASGFCSTLIPEPPHVVYTWTAGFMPTRLGTPRSKVLPPKLASGFAGTRFGSRTLAVAPVHNTFGIHCGHLGNPRSTAERFSYHASGWTSTAHGTGSFRPIKRAMHIAPTLTVGHPTSARTLP
jgi:hypothetical protein